MQCPGHLFQELRVNENPNAPRLSDEVGFETLCAHFAEDRRSAGPAAPPLIQSSTFVYPDAAAFETRDDPQPPHFDYTRRANPTTTVLERKLAALEHGTWARVCASGMGAITAAINLPLSQGAHVVCVHDCYHPTRRYLTDYLQRFGVTATFVPGVETEAYLAAMRPETRLLYLESPTSGRFDVLDVPALASAARARGILTIHDNSWASPYWQNPLELGCDLVVHSATKYIGGHSDVVAGAVIGRNPDLGRRVAVETEWLGATPDPFAAWLLLRGLRTLPVRMRQHQDTTLQVAHLLAAHPAVAAVHYPGLPGHPGHTRARSQLRGFSGVLSFELREQSRAATHRFLNRLRLFGLGCSWGGFESLALGGEAKLLFSAPHGRAPWLIRLSLGLETTADLLADLAQALEG